MSAKTITVPFILVLLVDQYIIMVLIYIFLITQIANDVKHFICLLDICISLFHCAQVFGDALSLGLWVVGYLYFWWIYSSRSLISSSNLYLYHLCHLYLCFISSSLWLAVNEVHCTMFFYSQCFLSKTKQTKTSNLQYILCVLIILYIIRTHKIYIFDVFHIYVHIYTYIFINL